MKYVLLMLMLCVTGLARAEEPATQPATRPAHIDHASYGIGFDMGKQIKTSPVALNVEQLIQGLRDGLAGKESTVSEADITAAMLQLQTDAAEARKGEGERNIKLGAEYRAKNGQKAGVKTTASGLQIETIEEGKGAAPTATDTVKVHYTGLLIDGTKFDSSLDHGAPVTFPLGGVIKGWTEGLQLMKVGGKSRLVVPPEIGYGPGGSGPIPPNATLIFEIELLGIESK